MRSPDVVAAWSGPFMALRCGQPTRGNHADLAQLLAQPRYVGAPARLLLAALDGIIRFEAGSEPLARPAFPGARPGGHRAARASYADLIHSRMRRWGQVGW